jgi:CDP-diacylglycerol--serine O-phosphatidyltransferase
MRQGIFILPSLLTLTSIFFSFYSIILGMKGQFLYSAALIIVAGFFDGIDGKVARLTKTTTKFGVELDSLADVISFGVAPALLMYSWALEPYGRLGWVSAFVFVTCGALRLARFNVQSVNPDLKKFNGLPIPAAAGMLATTVVFMEYMEINPADYRLILLLSVLCLAFFMVSTIKFHAFKDLTLVKAKPFTSTLAFVLLLALIALMPYQFPFLLCLVYVLSGPVFTIINRGKKSDTLNVAPSGPTIVESALHQKPESDQPESGKSTSGAPGVS